MRDFIEYVIVPVLLLCVVVIGGLGGLIYVLVSYDCSNYQEITGAQTKSTITTCYIKHDDRWLTYSEFKASKVGNLITLDK